MRMITLLIALSAILFVTSCKRQVIRGVVIAKGETEYAIEHIDKGVLPFEFRSVPRSFILYVKDSVKTHRVKVNKETFNHAIIGEQIRLKQQ